MCDCGSVSDNVPAVFVGVASREADDDDAEAFIALLFESLSNKFVLGADIATTQQSQPIAS
jgi:hypothetical protein